VTTASPFEAAVECHRRGRLAEAERLYRQVTAQDPSYANASFLLGAISLAAGRAEAAVPLFRRAIEVDPANPTYHANLGEAYRRLGRLAETVDALLAAIRLKPDLAEPVYNLGLLLHDHGESAVALACFERAAELRPNVPQIRDRLVQARRQADQNPTATSGSSAAARVLTEMAASLGLQGRAEEAMALCRRALEIDPRQANAHNNLGAELLRLERIDDALESFRQAIAVDAHHVEAHCNLGNALGRSGFIGDALASFHRANEIRPTAAIHSNILFTMPFLEGCSPDAMLREARAWDRRYGAPLATGRTAHDNDRAPERRLRVGYVSPDFRAHCQVLYTVPLLSHHDHDAFEIHCYSAVRTPDHYTDRLRRHADRWCNIATMTDAEAAARIREDRIDILVDLTMHMDGNRAGVFARKPAPLQVCWLAYPGTTGLSAMDYRITDPHLDPPGSEVSVYGEQSLWLPDSFWCYDPLADGPEVGPLPARASAGDITYGCLNNFAKVTPRVLEVWARVLERVTGSRLLMMAPEGECRRRTSDFLAGLGVDPARVEFVGRRARPEYLATYGRIDVCLDTFPSNGHTTSLDALWMGVPVVTLAGQTIVGRAGVCQAKNLELDDLVAATPDEYVRLAASVAEDLDRLGALRAGLRERMERSPLMDGARFARHLEAAYRRIWRRWCEERS
jgi:predicted O-linked N-acetylglucosamine transferase (SPINDLY family)